jgi:sucrose-6-phosphate hydrolase SacC (GH32 family)
MTKFYSFLLCAAVAADSNVPLTCQPLEAHPTIPIFHIIGNISVNASQPSGLEFEHINDANGIFKYKGLYHVFHQCCQNHWDHAVSKDLIHWKRLPSPVRPDTDPQHWYDSHGSFDGSAAILPGKGPVILVDNIGPFTPPAGQLGDNPGCQGLSWPIDLDDAELTHWRKDAANPLNISNLPCGSRTKNMAGAFPGSIYKNGDHWNYLSFGYRFSTTDFKLHEWHQEYPQFLSTKSSDERGGQWTLRLPRTTGSTNTTLQPTGNRSTTAEPSHIVSCGSGNRFCAGKYNLTNETWVDYRAPQRPGFVNPCKKFARNMDVPGGDYNRNESTRGLWKGCSSDGQCPCQQACLNDATCDAWTVVPKSRCCLKRFSQPPTPITVDPSRGLITGVKDTSICIPDTHAFRTDLGPDAAWFTAGYESGSMGEGGADRLLNIGWATAMSFDPLHMRRAGDKSGGLTVPREIRWEESTKQLVANPVEELIGLRNSTLANETLVELRDGALHALEGTGGGAAASADVELSFVLPTAGASATFGVVLLSSRDAPSHANNRSGVTITASVGAALADGSRVGVLKLFVCGMAACVHGSKFPCEQRCGYAIADEPFTVLKGESEVSMRVLVDRVIVEAFVQQGRAVVTKSFIPPDSANSVVHLLSINGSTTASKATVWSMGCGWVGVDEQWPAKF